MLAGKPTYKITTFHTLDIALDGEDLAFTVDWDDTTEDELVLKSGDVTLAVRRDDLKSLGNTFGVSPA